MHFCRSTFIALAVTAMIGREANSAIFANRVHGLIAVHLRHHDVHQHDVEVRMLLQFFDAVDPFSA